MKGCATGERALERFLKTRIGGTAQVLIEQNGVGLSEHYASVRIAGAKSGDLVSAAITGIDGANLVGQIVQ